MSLIVAENLAKTYVTGAVRVEALKHLTFSIDRASFVSFIGPSDSGKTTLLNLIGRSEFRARYYFQRRRNIAKHTQP
jgi:putative ABC transport system ATP-binding protein